MRQVFLCLIFGCKGSANFWFFDKQVFGFRNESVKKRQFRSLSVALGRAANYA